MDYVESFLYKKVLNVLAFLSSAIYSIFSLFSLNQDLRRYKRARENKGGPSLFTYTFPLFSRAFSSPANSVSLSPPPSIPLSLSNTRTHRLSVCLSLSLFLYLSFSPCLPAYFPYTINGIYYVSLTSESIH